MPWLQYDVMEVDPDAQAEWEAENYTAGIEYNKAAEAAEKAGEAAPDAPEAKPAPEPESVTKTVELSGDARLTGVNSAGNYFNIALGTDGVSKVEILDEDPNPPEEEAAATTKATTSKTSSASSSSS